MRRRYRLEGLQLRMRVRRRKYIALHRGPAPRPAGPTERWSRDFVDDALAWTTVPRPDGRRSVEAPESDVRGGVEYVGPCGRRRAGSRAHRRCRSVVDHRRPRYAAHVTRARGLGVCARRATRFIRPGNPWKTPSSRPSTGDFATSV